MPTDTHDLTPTELAETIGCSTETVRNWCRTGLVPGAYRKGLRAWFIPRDTADQIKAEGLTSVSP